MRIRPEWSGTTLIVKTDQSGLAYIRDDWPQDCIEIEPLLKSLFGAKVNGWYVYHEMDHRWLFCCLEAVATFSQSDIVPIALCDPARIGYLDLQISVVRAASIAVRLIQKAFEVDREDAAALVRMNLSIENAVA